MAPSLSSNSSIAVRTKTLDELGIDIDLLNLENHQSQVDQPKIVHGADSRKNISHPKFDQFSKVLLSRDAHVCRPAHLSEWVKTGSFPSTLGINSGRYNRGLSFVADTETILVDVIASTDQTTVSREFLRCGPRETLAFHPSNQVKPCIVTCGGLCPGLNNVIRELVMTLNMYHVKPPYSGIPYGLKGFYETGLDIIPLTMESVSGINHEGGTILGSSRGGFDCKKIFDAIEAYGFNCVFLIGGDGTHRAIDKLYQESKKRKSAVAICGITKSIDQDIPLIDRCFGFDTAVEESQRAIRCAKIEAKSAENGIGLVQLMGRHSGNICLFAALASREVDCCLIPEVEFQLEGENGLFSYVRQCLREKGHMVIVVAEGAGSNLLPQGTLGCDKSGNLKLPNMGEFLKSQINAWAKTAELDITLKHIDPTYMVRSVVANASDQLFCALLAQSAVHACLAGFTGFTVGLINTHFCMIPLSLIVDRKRAKVDIHSRMWNRLITATGQPILSGTAKQVEDAESKPEPTFDGVSPAGIPQSFAMKNDVEIEDAKLA